MLPRKYSTIPWASKVMTSHILANFPKVSATRIVHLPKAGSQVVGLDCCDEAIVLYSLQYSHDLPSLEASSKVVGKVTQYYAK
jgi:hypothetical protein